MNYAVFSAALHMFVLIQAVGLGLVETRTGTPPILREMPGRNKNLTNKDKCACLGQPTRDEPQPKLRVHKCGRHLHVVLFNCSAVVESVRWGACRT